MHSQVLETGSEISKLVGALLAELADELPEGVHLESVRADLLAASRSYEHGKKQDLALRFYLAFRSMLHEFARLQKIESQASQSAASPAGDSSDPSPNVDEPRSYIANMS
jgi:hypothetical protein